jgi:hypothetical protein
MKINEEEQQRGKGGKNKQINGPQLDGGSTIWSRKTSEVDCKCNKSDNKALRNKLKRKKTMTKKEKKGRFRIQTKNRPM